MIEQILKTIEQVPNLRKGDRNPHGGYNYVSIDDYYEQVAKIAASNGITWKAREVSSEIITLGEKADKRGVMSPVFALKTKYEFDVLVRAERETTKEGELVRAAYTSAHEGFFSCTILHPLQGAQTAGSSLSYADKLFMRTVFKVVTGEGDADASDNNAFSTDDPLDMSPAPRQVRKKRFDKDVENILDGLQEVVDIAEGRSDGSEYRVHAPKADDAQDEGVVAWFVGLVEAFLPMAKTTDELEKYWHDNEHNIDAVKDEDPEAYKRIVNMFKVRKLEIKKGK